MDNDQAKNDDQPIDQPVAEEIKPTEETKPDLDKIEVQQYDTPLRRPLATLEETLGEQKEEDKTINFPTRKPVFATNDASRAVMTTTIVMILVLALGFGAGFGSYKLLQNQAASADRGTETKTTTPAKTINTETTVPTKTTTGPTASWSSYNNTKYLYSLQYPDTWFSQSTNTAESTTVQFTSFRPDQATSGELTAGAKIEITFQDTNGKTLTDWIEANNASMNAKTESATTLTIGGQSATQQTIIIPIKSIATYLLQANKVMVISYYAAEKDFATNQSIYDNIIKSIQLK